MGPQSDVRKTMNWTLIHDEKEKSLKFFFDNL